MNTFVFFSGETKYYKEVKTFWKSFIEIEFVLQEKGATSSS